MSTHEYDLELALSKTLGTNVDLDLALRKQSDMLAEALLLLIACRNTFRKYEADHRSKLDNDLTDVDRLRATTMAAFNHDIAFELFRYINRTCSELGLELNPDMHFVSTRASDEPADLSETAEVLVQS